VKHFTNINFANAEPIEIIYGVDIVICHVYEQFMKFTNPPHFLLEFGMRFNVF
jgi:hypothetical protein